MDNTNAVPPLCPFSALEATAGLTDASGVNWTVNILKETNVSSILGMVCSCNASATAIRHIYVADTRSYPPVLNKSRHGVARVRSMVEFSMETLGSK